MSPTPTSPSKPAAHPPLRPVFQHPWKITPTEAIQLQHQLAQRVSLQSAIDLRRARYLLATDVSYSRPTDHCYAAAILWDLVRHEPLRIYTAHAPSPFPYVPGLLSFREIPLLIQCIQQHQGEPIDLLLAEGQGIAHPRRLGLASHLGVLYDLPCAGSAKSRLIGEHAEPGPHRGAHATLTHNGQAIGEVLRTRDNVQPLYVSPGHRIAPPQVRRLILRLCSRYRQPDPLRLAHHHANALRREIEAPADA